MVEKQELKKQDDLSNEDREHAEEIELEDVLESVPPEHRKTIEQMMISSVQMRSIATAPENVVMKKITEEHISKYLDGAEIEMKSSYKEKLHRKIFNLLSMFFAMIFLIVIIVLLKETPEIMEKVIFAVGGVIAGAFGGYGYGLEKNKRDE